MGTDSSLHHRKPTAQGNMGCCCSNFLMTLLNESRHTVVYQQPRKACGTQSVLFTGTTKSPFSIHHISITTGLISIKFKYFIPSLYTTLHTNFQKNLLSSLQDKITWFSSSFLPSLHWCKNKLFMDCQIWYTSKAHCGLS